MMPPISPLAYPQTDLFLLGYIVGCSFVAALFFLRFWKSSRDILFLAFAIFFVVQCVEHIAVAGKLHPNEGDPWHFVLRLLSILGILAAILWKNVKEH